MKDSPEEPKEIIEPKKEFPIWKEIIPDPEITSAETAIRKLEKEGYKINDYAKDMLTKVDWEKPLKDSYEIVSISVGELFGDTEGHTYLDIRAKAIENGLDIIPAALAPEIRSNYPKNGDHSILAMEAIRDSNGSLGFFSCLGNDSGSYLSTGSPNPYRKLNDNDRLFFVRK